MPRIALALAALLFALPAWAESATARIGSKCVPENGTIVVPAGKTARNFRVTSLSHGTTCGVTAIDYTGWGITNKYRYFKPASGSVTDSPALSTLTLGPGTYSLYVDGGSGAQVVIQYDL